MWLSWLTWALLLGTLCAGKGGPDGPVLCLWVKGQQVATLQPANTKHHQEITGDPVQVYRGTVKVFKCIYLSSSARADPLWSGSGTF